MISTTPLYLVLISLVSVRAVTPQCTKLESGALWTNSFGDDEARRPYAFNSRNEVAYHKTGSHPRIMVDFQACSPNYAQESNTQGDRYYGRFKIQGTSNCLAVSNPSGPPPYYITVEPCPAVTKMASSGSVPFNFIGYLNDEINYQWYGRTIPSKGLYQGVLPGSRNCQGSYLVNATTSDGTVGRGEPSVSGSSGELNRVHLYCPKGKSGKYVTSFNTFILISG